ncbi:MAG TPA: hypothetical protein PKK99_13450 [Bacteroidia bacterium]|nr:hypothetical protein [Bacteroidia bacterium]
MDSLQLFFEATKTLGSFAVFAVGFWLKSLVGTIKKINDSLGKIEIWIASHSSDFSNLVNDVEEVKHEQKELLKAWNEFYRTYSPHLTELKNSKNHH